MTTATLTFTRPTTRKDGSALAPEDIDQIQIFVTDATHPDPDLIGTITDKSVNSFKTPELNPGTNDFMARVVDVNGHVSEDSNIASVEVPATQAAPSAITDLKAALDA